MTKYAAELDTASAVLAARVTSGGSPTPPRPACCRHAVHVGGDALDRLDPRTRRRSGEGRYGDTGMPVAGEGARWWRSSRSPSSPPRSGCPPMPGSGTSATPSSSPTGCRGCGGGWCRVTCGRGWPAGSPTRPSCSPRRRRGLWTGTWRRWRTRSDPSSSNGWWTRRSRRSCPTWPRNVGWRRRTAGTSPSSSSRSPTPAPAVHGELDLADALDLEHADQPVAAQLKDLGSTDSLTSAGRPRSVSSPARQLALDLDPVVEEGAPRPSRNHHPAPGRAVRPPLPGTPSTAGTAARAGQPADHRRPGPRLVRHAPARSP